MSFCGKCGAPRVAGSKFCTVCGAAQPPTDPVPEPSAPVPSPVAPPAYTPVPTYAQATAPAPGAKKSNTLLKVIIVVVVILFIGAGLTLAGLYYAAMKVKEKVHSVTAQVMSGVPPSADPPSNPSGPPPPPAASTFPAWSPSSASTPNIHDPAPAKTGMLVVTAIADADGDYESLKQIVSMDNSGITLSYHSEGAKGGEGAAGASSRNKPVAVQRLVLAQDLDTAHDYAEIFRNSDPRSFPGTTAITASREVLAELKQKGSTAFSFRPQGLAGALGSLAGTLSALAGSNNKNVGGVSLDTLGKKVCSLQREGNGLYAFPVLLNSQPVTVPAVRASCVTDDGRAEFYILDQRDYPLMLVWKLGEGSQLQVIKISYPPAPAAQKSNQTAQPSRIEQQLKENKKVDIYGIYFDFASDQLKPESTPVLEEIAGVLKDNPDWKLTVSGHTDNVGGDAYNLDLSKRRAAAVKQVLVTQYHIAPERLSTDGFGASRPVDTNDTLAGRARNRRVELTRE